MSRARDTANTQDNVGGAVAPYVAGKNKIINGDFGVWQRGTSFTATGATTYTADRFINYYNSSPTVTVSRQSFTAGELTAATSPYYYRFAQTTAGTGMTYSSLCAQFVEDVRTLQGTVTFSFYAKSSISTTKLAVGIFQVFGTGGSSTNFQYSANDVSISTSWQRYSVTLTLDSLSGKTIGANSCLQPSIEFAATSRNVVQTVDIWGEQLEAGSVATPFTTASGSIGGELALCQRYYWRMGGKNAYEPLAQGNTTGTTAGYAAVKSPATMRIVPTSIDYSTIGVAPLGSAPVAITSATIGGCNNDLLLISFGGTGFAAANTQIYVTANNSTSAYLGFNAEL